MTAAAIIPILPAIQLKRILYATDFSEGAQAALPIVSAIARHYHSEVYMSHVWSPAPYPMVSPEALAAIDEQERAARQKVGKILPALSALGISAKPVRERSWDKVLSRSRYISTLP